MERDAAPEISWSAFRLIVVERRLVAVQQELFLAALKLLLILKWQTLRSDFRLLLVLGPVAN